MAGGNHHKPSPSNRKSRWEANSSSATAAASNTKSPSDPKPKPNNTTPNPKPNPNPSPKHPTDHPPLIPFPFPERGPPPPPAYGFHMLERRTIVLADGSVRSYFALPPDYQDFPPPPRHLDRFDMRFPPRPDFRNPMEPPAKRKYGDEDGGDEFAKQREQLLRNANNGFASGGSLKRDLGGDAAESRPSKQSRVDGVGGSGSNSGVRNLQVDQDALKKAFFNFVKLINENTTLKKSYLEDGKQGRLQCVACGSANGRFG